MLTGLPAIVISLIALGVAIWNVIYNRTKDARARRQSIEDDFWLRKVVSPLSIEPFLKHVNQLVASLPLPSGSTQESVREFWSAHALKLGEFTIAFRTLSLIDEQLDADVALEIEKLDDQLALYCGALSQHLDSTLTSAPDRDEVSRKMMGLTIGVFKLVKTHQSEVGFAS